MTDKIVEDIFHALDMGRNRLQWYTVTKDEQLMVDCKDWNRIASDLMNKLIMEQKNEVRS